MGLDTTHDAWHGAYSAFTRWRHAVAEAAGYRIIKPTIEQVMAGEVADTIPFVDIPWDDFPPERYQGEWGDQPPVEDPLLVLIVHSDCDGVIHPREARMLADRLEQLLPKLTNEGHGHLERMNGYAGATARFVAGLRDAVAAGEDVEFL